MPDPINPILVSRKGAAAALSIGVRTWDRLESAGKIGPMPMKLGGSVRYELDELRRWIRSCRNGTSPTRLEWLALNEETKR